jgi:hypothetical protein
LPLPSPLSTGLFTLFNINGTSLSLSLSLSPLLSVSLFERSIVDQEFSDHALLFKMMKRNL